MKVTLIGDQSDIGIGLKSLLEADGHEVVGWNRNDKIPPRGKWDLFLNCLGVVAPVGLWNESMGWEACFQSNLFLPVYWLRALWADRLPNASVCFLAGSNPQKIMSGYAPYNASKMALLKVVEQLDFETPDVKFFALGPGYIDTKIHKPTLEKNWPNERIAKGNPNTIEQVYETLKWCWKCPKEVVGGRNICVSDMDPELADQLLTDKDMFKLRRSEK